MQILFYFRDENTKNTCIFHSKVKLWNEGLSRCPPPRRTCTASVSYLQPQPPTLSRSSGGPGTTGSCGLLRAPRKVPASPLSYGHANGTRFYYLLEIAPKFFRLRSQPTSPVRAGTAPPASVPVPWIHQRDNFVLETALAA